MFHFYRALELAKRLAFISFFYVDGAKGKVIKNENLSKWKEFAQNVRQKV